jgi:hypothetical protein
VGAAALVVVVVLSRQPDAPIEAVRQALPGDEVGEMRRPVEADRQIAPDGAAIPDSATGEAHVRGGRGAEVTYRVELAPPEEPELPEEEALDIAPFAPPAVVKKMEVERAPGAAAAFTATEESAADGKRESGNGTPTSWGAIGEVWDRRSDEVALEGKSRGRAPQAAATQALDSAQDREITDDSPAASLARLTAAMMALGLPAPEIDVDESAPAETWLAIADGWYRVWEERQALEAEEGEILAAAQDAQQAYEQAVQERAVLAPEQLDQAVRRLGQLQRLLDRGPPPARPD